MRPPSRFRFQARLGLALVILAAGLAPGCGRLQPGPGTEEVQRAMTWYLKKMYAKQYAFPGGNNFFVPGQGAKLTVEENGATTAAPPFVYTITKRYTKTTGGERWFCYDFTATGHLEPSDVTFHGVVALVKRGKTWFFHRGDDASQ
ncbi:MAG TPA: hypothetical protein VLT83_12370 [Opitutaceae bacterium]|nr:hypothetical protein [Opitutaceae bacterium]